MPFLFGLLYRGLGRAYFVLLGDGLLAVFRAPGGSPSTPCARWRDARAIVGAARETGDVVLLTEATKTLLGGAVGGVEARGEAELRGITEPVSIYALDTGLDNRPTRPQTTLITDA